MMTKKIISLLLATALLSGCSVFRSSRQQVFIQTNSPGAVILVDGAYVGKGNASVRVNRNMGVVIEAKQPGFASAKTELTPSLNATGILDFVGGFLLLVPFIGLIAPGSKSLNETHVSLFLLPSASRMPVSK